MIPSPSHKREIVEDEVWVLHEYGVAFCTHPATVLAQAENVMQVDMGTGLFLLVFIREIKNCVVVHGVEFVAYH